MAWTTPKAENPEDVLRRLDARRYANKRDIIEIDQEGYRVARGAKRFKARLACGHNVVCDVQDRDRGWTYCMKCYFK